jgi:hypothetical protein
MIDRRDSQLLLHLFPDADFVISNMTLDFLYDSFDIVYDSNSVEYIPQIRVVHLSYLNNCEVRDFLFLPDHSDSLMTVHGIN